MELELNSLKKEIEIALKEKEIIVDNVSLDKQGKYAFLTITLDKVNGIDLDSIVDATHIINPIVDKWDKVDDSFILDVISKERN